MLKRFVLMIITMAVLFAASAWAAVDVYEFSSEDQRQRYQKFIEELRCPKCKNNNLAGTNSQIAIDLRRELHRMVVEGQTDEEILEFMVSRYGDFVLYRPRLQRSTFALWLGPLLFVGIGGLVVAIVVWRRRHVAQVDGELSETERQELDKMLKSDAKKK